MEISEADMEWNQMITLLNSNDPKEKELGKKLRANIWRRWPEICKVANMDHE